MDTERRAPVVCYRHPDRPTRLSCSDCGRPICVDCSRDAAVGQKCPECAAPEGRGRVVDARAVYRVDRTTSPVSLALIAINVAIFMLGLLSPELDRTFFREGAQFGPAIEAGEWWRALTAMFLHGGFTHILFNMWALWLFGPTLERRHGSVPFAALYVASGVSGAALYHTIGQTAPAVGASGAIFGLFGAMLMASYRQRHTVAGRAVFGQLMFLLVINLTLPLFVPNIAWEAHVGGLIAGALIAAAWDRMPRGEAGVEARRTGFAVAVGLVAFLVVLLA